MNASKSDESSSSGSVRSSRSSDAVDASGDAFAFDATDESFNSTDAHDLSGASACSGVSLVTGKPATEVASPRGSTMTRSSTQASESRAELPTEVSGAAVASASTAAVARLTARARADFAAGERDSVPMTPPAPVAPSFRSEAV